MLCSFPPAAYTLNRLSDSTFFVSALALPLTLAYDDVYGELSLDGKTVWERRKEQRTDLYKGQTMTLYNSGATPLTLNYGEARQLRLIARLMDYDSTSADDVIGLWNTTIDLRSVADAFKNGKTRVVHEFRKRGEADADGVLILEFSRN